MTERQGSTATEAAADTSLTTLIWGWAGICEEVHRSRVQLWRDIRAGRFPAPIEIGANSIAWYRAEVEAWKASRPRRSYSPKALTPSAANCEPARVVV